MSDTGDKAIRMLGTFALWRNIVVGGIVVVLAIVAIFYVIAYHANWKSGTFALKTIDCKPPKEAQMDCNRYGCKTKQVTDCSMTLEGIAGTFEASYVAPQAPPKIGDEVKAFFSPDESEVLLAHNDPLDAHKKYIVLGLVVLVLVFGASVGFQFYVRRSHLAQRVAGGATVFNMVTDL